MPEETFTQRLPDYAALDVNDLKNIASLLPDGTYIVYSHGHWRNRCTTFEEFLTTAKANGLETIKPKNALTIRVPALQMIIRLDGSPAVRIRHPTNEALGIVLRIGYIMQDKLRYPVGLIAFVCLLGIASGFYSAIIYTGLTGIVSISDIIDIFRTFPARFIWPLVSIGASIRFLRSPRLTIYLQEKDSPSKLVDRISMIAACISAIAGVLSVVLSRYQGT